MQIPILNGINTNESSDFRTSYPRNLIPVIKQTGISNGYLRPADGVVQSGEGPGVSRGSISWNGICYRVMGTKLVSVGSDNVVTIIGDVGGGAEQVSLDYSFDYLAIASDNKLWLYDGVTLTQNTDPDLGIVLDVVWVDGYFMTTDGESLVVTELNNPFAVDPLKYGSSEIDPDPVVALLKLRDEVYAINSNTIEVFDNIGGDNFPFQRIDGAQIQKGAVGTFACCVFIETIAFVGSGRNEAPAVYLGTNAQTAKVSTREIDEILKSYTEAQLSSCILQSKIDKDHEHLWVILPNRTLVYDAAASKIAREHIWVFLTSSLEGLGQLKIKDLVWCYGKWLTGDPTSNKLGYLTNETSSQYGNVIGWEFNTLAIYNEGNNALIHELELVCLSGRVEIGENPIITTQYSLDGEVWSMEQSIYAGKQGERNKRLTWFQQGEIRNWRIQKFKGDSRSLLSIGRLEARLEPLNYAG